MKNFILFLFCFLLLKTNTFSQGFVSNGTNIYLTNSAGSATVAPFPNVGIGTNIPSAQLHTTSTVRFQGIANDNTQTRVIVSDASGNLRWRDASTIGTSGIFWNLAGNSISGSEFIGTTNSQPFIIRTNNLERLRITPTGNIGIGTTTPTYKLDINANTNSSMRFISTGGYASAIFKGQGSTDSYSYSFIQLLSNESNNGWLIANRKYDWQKDGLMFSYFRQSTNQWYEQIIFKTDTVKGKVFVGIGTTNPTCRLHVVDSVRFENLPTGIGNILVIDANGYVKRATSTSSLTNNINDNSLSLLLERIAILEKKLEILESKNIGNINQKFKLYQNIPNPANGTTEIAFEVENYQNSSIIIYDLNGNIISTHDLKELNDKINIATSILANGSYLYSLVSNG